MKCKYDTPCVVANQLNTFILKRRSLEPWKSQNRRVMVILSGWGVYPVSPRESDEHRAFLDIVRQIFEQILYKQQLLEKHLQILYKYERVEILTDILHILYKNLKVQRGKDEH